MNATALAAITCISGPPWSPGKTCLSSALACFALLTKNPPRGPRSVLCVVDVTTSACGTGLGCTPPATSPAMCAMSTMSTASTSRAMPPNASKSMIRGYALAPATISFGRSRFAISRTSS